ncbi:MAG: DNA/RNA non-specific endonuclease [Chlamydiia bacterium]|nr:DNA/RNA non-specific endonuclease [Chlamydiia bacterium]
MKRFKKGIGFIAGAIFGVASVISYQEWGKNLEPSSFPTFKRKGYTLAYDTRGKIPFWTHEHLTVESLEKNVERAGIPFSEDQEIYQLHRSKLSDYAKSGFDRGHITPAGDVPFSKEALEETFYLSNICPQNPQFNRGVWKKLEQHIRSLVREEGELEVITGPLFLSHEEGGKRFVTYQVIGESEVAVPTHFFKVVSQKGRVWGYVIPNQPIDGELETYLFPVERLEKISGIQFQKPIL